MNKFFRLLLILIPAWRARKGLTFQSRRTMRYRLSWPKRLNARDLEPLSIATSFDVALADFLVSCHVGDVVRAQGWTPILVKKRVNMAMPRPDVDVSKVEIETHLTAWTHQATILAHTVKAGGETIATGLTLGRFVTGKGRPNPDTVLLAELLGKPGLTSPPYSDEVKHFLEGAPVT